MLTLAFAAALAVTVGIPMRRTWYGPVTVTFEAQFPGNPYDPGENDVKVVFTGADGHKEERLAYFAGPGKWQATLVAEQKGRYKASLIRNGEASATAPDVKELVLETPIPHGFVRRDPEAANRFAFDDGTRFYPVGHDLGWQTATLTLPEQIKLMGENGVDWARIWAASWSSMNPWWPNDSNVKPGELWPKALDNWQEVVEACDRAGVKFQFVLFNHGLFSSTVNPNWPDHPWNAAKGGFLKSAAAFFTDPEAIRRTKMWLRYAVARWGASPSIMAWELFNEVEWVDAMRYAPDTVFAWHKDMAAYLRQIDPYRHLVTTSSTMEATHLWDAMDYYQPHTYPVDVATAISGEPLPPGKPLFFGEFGASSGPGKDERRVIRDGVYASMLSNHAGTAMYWSWDRVESEHLYGEYKLARKILERSKLALHDAAKPVRLRVATAGQGDLDFRPSKGWAATDRFEFSLPDDVVPAAMNEVSSFLQSETGSHADMGGKPLDFKFDAKSAGTAELHLVTLSRAGAHVHLYLDSGQVAEYVGPAGDGDRPINVTLRAKFGPGAHTVRVSNDGADWLVFDRLRLSPFGPDARVQALTDSDWMMARATAEHANLELGLAGLSLASGDYDVEAFDLDTGAVVSRKVSVKAGALTKRLELPGKDYVLLFERHARS